MTTFEPGAIVRLYLKNFLTYNELTFKPAPGLNLIIGANGSGKSSLVCAICLVLAGSTKILGRAKDAAHFIKYNRESAILEIELFCSSGNEVIRREIKSSGSEWKINGKRCKEEHVVKLVQSFKIQVDNLCQFLPQDRVADFARMTPQELLNSTEKAVGDEELIWNRVKLNELQKDYEIIKSNVENLALTVMKEINFNEQLIPELEQYREFNEAKARLDTIEAKLAWIHYVDKREDFLSLKSSLTGLQKELRDKEQAVADTTKQLDISKRQQDEKTEQRTAAHQAYNRIKRELEQHRHVISRSTERIDAARRTFQQHVDVEQDRRNKLQSAVASFESIKHQYRTLKEDTSYESLQMALKAIKTKIHGITEEATALEQRCQVCERDVGNHEAAIAEAGRRLREIKLRDELLMKKIKSMKPHVYETSIWLKANEGLFKRKIYQPVLTFIGVTDGRHAKLLEAAIGKDSLFTFVAEDADDMEEFVKLTRKQGWRINAALVPNKPKAGFKIPVIQGQLAPNKIDGFLIDFLGGKLPDALITFLCACHKLHLIPYGGEGLETTCYELNRQYNLSVFAAADTWITLIKSKYANDIIKSSRMMGEPRLLNVQDVDSMIDDLNNEITVQTEKKSLVQEELYGNKNRINQLNQTAQNLRVEEQRLNGKASEFASLERSLSIQRSRINRLQDESEDIDQHGRTVEQEEKKEIDTYCKALKNLVQSTKMAKAKLEELTLMTCDLEDLTKKQMSLLRSHGIADQARDAARASFDRVKAQVDEAKRDALFLLENAKKFINLPNQNSTTIQLPIEYQRIFANLPNDEAALNAIVDREKARLVLICPQNKNVESEYEQREKRIEELKQEHKNESESLLAMIDELERIRVAWTEKIVWLIAQVDRNFQRLFSLMRCKGCVRLYTSEEEHRYDTYGIKIYVSFRDGCELCELTPFHQSGGEKSVATIVYMMALQELSAVPFRVVDEINQGMDSTNERAIFDFIVRTAESNNFQYFMVTPKLLPNLSFSEKMHIHTIFQNVSFQSSDWNIDDMIKARKAGHR